ncbi:MAG: hypothetical protein ABIH10_01310, partial [Spirochaetota bacterium]
MFNYNTLEKDIERLSKEVVEKKNLPEYKETSGRELIKQIITPLVLQTRKPVAEPIDNLQDIPNKDEETFLPDYLKNSPAEIK